MVKNLNGVPNKNLTFDFLSPRSLKKERDSYPKNVWAIGGGKGGTGKTLLTANMGVKLAQSNRKVLLIDADLGGANLHTCLGISNPKKTLGDFLSHEKKTLEEILIETSVKSLYLINGSGDMLDVANLKHTQKMRFIRQFKKLEMDYVILDLGAGTNFNILDFFINADVGILVVMPEPTSVENSYRFLKSVFYRKLRGVVSMPLIKKMVDDVISKREKTELRTPFDLLKKVEAIDKASCNSLLKVISDFRIKLVMNQIKAESDLSIGHAMAKACKRYFGIDTEFIGSVHYDDKVWKSIQAKIPVTIGEPESRASKEISDLTQKLMRV